MPRPVTHCHSAPAVGKLSDREGEAMIDLAGRTIVFLCRLQHLPHRLVAHWVGKRGALIRRSLSRTTDYAVFGGGACAWLADARLRSKAEAAERVGAACLGEAQFLRRLGLLPALAPERLTITFDELARVGGLDRGLLGQFVLLGVFEGEEDRFTFGSLAMARTAARLLGEGVPSAEVAAGLLAARQRHGQRATALVRRRDGSLGVRWGEEVTDVSGQLRLPLAEPRMPSVDRLFEAAEAADEAGDVAEAERLYQRCLGLDRTDPCAAFGLGNLLHRQGRDREAKLYFCLAAGIDPRLAEAWCSLAMLCADEGKRGEAREHYARALAADPTYDDALFNAAMNCFEMADYAEAGSLWERYLTLGSGGERAKKARHGLAYCRRMIGRGDDHA